LTGRSHTPEIARFFAKVEFTPTCWIWTASQDRHGYGQFPDWQDGKTIHKGRSAHRLAYTYMKGPIPEGFDLDHLCRVPLCVNPLHLEAVTRQENAQRGLVGIKSGQLQQAKTHCPQGHEYNLENTYLDPAGHGRQCFTCRRTRAKKVLA
jgi:hypothetical protein